MIENHGHTSAVDWWTLGILLYEMMVREASQGVHKLTAGTVCHDAVQGCDKE